jgi:hypothetical protein
MCFKMRLLALACVLLAIAAANPATSATPFDDFINKKEAVYSWNNTGASFKVNIRVPPALVPNDLTAPPPLFSFRPYWATLRIC